MRLLAFFMMSVLFMPLSVDAVMTERNVLPNGSFENRPGGKDENPQGWEFWNSDYNGLAINKFKRGSQCAYFSCPPADDVEGIYFDYMKVKPGKQYVFSCYAMNCSENPIKGDAFGEISIEWRKKSIDRDGKEFFIEISRSWGPKFGPELSCVRWRPFTMTATAPADSDCARFVIQFFNKGDGSGKFFADDAEMEEINKTRKIKTFLLPSP